MLQALSFISVFHEARERGLRLNNFFQLADGSFRANWRLDGDKTWFGAFADHARPFDALLNAYVLADLTAPGTTRGIDPGLREHIHDVDPKYLIRVAAEYVSEIAAPEMATADDLFG
jgi:hypothetical protein